MRELFWYITQPSFAVVTNSGHLQGCTDPSFAVVTNSGHFQGCTDPTRLNFVRLHLIFSAKLLYFFLT